ncbi:hypothetical protein Y032_0139g2131 [Ancylostoma ceylanicum]|nr:hypothetical protein Y032_0139g2131 [Ancylostoma ceylanicum]
MFWGLNDGPSSSTQVALPKAFAILRYNKLIKGSGDPQASCSGMQISCSLLQINSILLSTRKEVIVNYAMLLYILSWIEYMDDKYRTIVEARVGHVSL